MICQVVFDLPLEGPFDYLIPNQLSSLITVGRRVKVSFGPRQQIGFVIGLLASSDVAKLKAVSSVADSSIFFNEIDLDFAKKFSSYYGCSWGESLASLWRNRLSRELGVQHKHNPQLSLYQCPTSSYPERIKEIIQNGPKHGRFLVLVPDTFRLETLSAQVPSAAVTWGTRSAVFEADGRYAAVLMVDDDDSSYKQEQTPMYDTRQVLLMRSQMYGFDTTFIGISPSVELMALVQEKKINVHLSKDKEILPAKIIDLTNYKYIPGLISPPVRDAIEAALKQGKKSLLILNRRGSYKVTRCVDCNETLKCAHCDSPLTYSRSERKFLCPHCTYSVPGDTACPKCRKPSWRSQGIGVQQVQTELKKHFILAKIASFEREGKGAKQHLGDFDILVATRAVLRFQGQISTQVAAFIDFDAELNRMDMRCGFNAFSLALHVAAMAQGPLLIQTRNPGHYVLKHLADGRLQQFYDEELALRQELGFSPFKHWIKINWRSAVEKSSHEAAQDVYNILKEGLPEDFSVTPPLADALLRKRDQFRFNVMMQTPDLSKGVALIKSALGQSKRRSRVIVTLNVDP